MIFNKKIGIDLGTANCLVYLENKGIVLNEPTVVAVSVEDRKVVAVGKEAKKMLGRTPGNIVASRPMRDGVIADYMITEAMLRYFLQKIYGKASVFSIFKSELMICIPAGCTQVERRAVEDAALSAGARKVYLVFEPLAAAIGAGVPIGEASGNMILDIGGGAAEAAVISLGGVVKHKSVRTAGNKLDDAIANWVRKKHGLIIGDTSAENIKIKIGSALKIKDDKKISIQGRDFISGLPKKVELSTNEVTEAINYSLMQIVNTVKAVLEQVPPELASDIIDKGIVMTGGTSMLKNFDRLLSQETGVPCYVAEDAIFCVAKGTGKILENFELYKRSISRR